MQETSWEGKAISKSRKSFELSFKHRITTQYVLALGVIAFLVAVSYFLLQELMATHASWASLINLSGRQRMLSQRISKLAHDLTMRSHVDRENIRIKIEERIDQMEKAHRVMIGGEPGGPIKVGLSDEVKEIFFYPPHELDKKIVRFIEAARSFITINDEWVSESNQYFLTIKDYSEKPLLDSLDALVDEFQKEAEANAVALERRVTLITIILLLTLVVEGVVIFRPLANRIQLSADEVAESQKKLSGITASLGEGVIVADKDGIITFANPMASSLTGYKDQELVGAPVTGLKIFGLDGQPTPPEEGLIMQALHSSPHETVSELVEPVSFRTREMTLERKTGDRLIIEVTASRLKERGHVVGAVASMRDITMRKTMESILAAKSELVQLLQEIAFAVNEVETVDEAMAVCLNKVLKHTIWEVGHAYKPDEDGTLYPTDLWVSKTQGKFESFRKATETTKFSPGAGLPGRVYLSRKPAWIKDVQKDPNFPRARVNGDIGVRAGLGFPVLEGDKVVAVLEFFSTRPMDPDESILGMANYLSVQLGRVTERKRAMETILRAKERAEEATRLKDKFISLVAHDMRAPLTTIVGMMKSLKTDAGNPLTAHQGDIITKTVISGENMLEMIDNLLDLEKLQSGQMKLEKLSLDARALAEEVVESLSYEAASKNIKLLNDTDRGVKILADYELIIEAIKNLVHNAIKFCSDGDQVVIFCPSREESAIGVRDTGPGIRKEIINDLFRHDVKTSTIGTSGERGTGLGLPLCHDIIKAHGGEIEVNSEEGKGATFLIRLPKKGEAEKATV